MRPARLERATFWFVAGKRHFSATSSFLLTYSNTSRYGVLNCLKLSGNNPIFQFSASVSASVKNYIPVSLGVSKKLYPSVSWRRSMKHRNGYVYRDGNSWVARVDFTDESGKRRVARRYCETKTEANRKRQDLVRDIEERGEKAVDGDKLTFKALADKYKETKLIPAEYVNQRKIAGVRSLAPALFAVEILVDHCGDRRLRDITHSDIEAFKLARLKVLTVRGTTRSIASVNRELDILRAILNFALRQDWISKNPFNSGASLISKADETHRERLMTFEEEKKLLAACEVDSRKHLRPILIAAVATTI